MKVVCPYCKQECEVYRGMAGKSIKCPACNKSYAIMPLARVASEEDDDEAAGQKTLLYLCAFIFTAVSFLILSVISAMLRASLFVYIPLAALVISLPFACFLYVLLAKAFAFSGRKREVSLFFDLIKLILWDPTEGMLLLKNKKITFVDDCVDDGGGARFIFPLFGEEVGIRVPLTILPAEIENKQVYTRDSIPLDLRMTIWWKVRDLRLFYLSISKEVHELGERGFRAENDGPLIGFANLGLDFGTRRQLECAESWIRISAEEETRGFTAEISTSLLVADKIMAMLPLQMMNPPQKIESAEPPVSPEEYMLEQKANFPVAMESLQNYEGALGVYQTATTALAERMLPKLNAHLMPKGLTIDRIALQEVQLPPAIQQKAIDAAKAWYGYIEARRLGMSEAAKVEELAKVIGAEPIGVAEALKSYQGTNVSVGVSGLLDQLFAKLATPGK